MISEDPRAQYFLIKKAFSELPGMELFPYSLESGEKVYDLFNCLEGGDHIRVAKDDPIRPLADLAYEVMHLSRSLESIGYPKSVWSPLIDQFENDKLPLRILEMDKGYANKRKANDRRGKAYLGAMMQELAAHREKSASDLPHVVYEGECGAGDISVKIALKPNNGRVVFIPVFFYQLCKAQSLNPENENQCNRWREPVSGVLYAAGDYFYRASWPNGTSKQGRLSFKGVQPGQTVTLANR